MEDPGPGLSDLLNTIDSKMSNSFFRPPTVTGHNFAARWAILMNFNSFESPKPYPFNLKNSIAGLIS